MGRAALLYWTSAPPKVDCACTRCLRDVLVRVGRPGWASRRTNVHEAHHLQRGGALFLAGSGMATAQSLADTAKNTQSQRKSAKRPARVCTNADVPVTAPSHGRHRHRSQHDAEGERPPPAPAGLEACPGLEDVGERRRRSGLAVPVHRARAKRSRARSISSKACACASRTCRPPGPWQLRRRQAAVGRRGPPARRAPGVRPLESRRREVSEGLADLEAEAKAASVPAGWFR